MPRIVVLGCSGAGKSTFARALSKVTGLPHISLDAMFWNPGWVESDRFEFRSRLAPILASENWILDGNYIGALDGAQMPRATHVFLFDLPRWLCLAGVVRRVVGGYGRVRPEMAPGCPERLDFTFLRYIWNFRTAQLPKLLVAIHALRPDQRMEVFHARQDANEALARIGRKGLA